jgi:ABC-type Fe3+/spermidine/putrescine transport system ATPase subunit
MESSEIARGRAMEDENARMKRIIANLSLESGAMKELIAKSSRGRSQRKAAVRALRITGREPTRCLPDRPLPTDRSSNIAFNA